MPIVTITFKRNMWMTAKLLIRISAVLIIVHLLGHTIGLLSWDDETGPLFGVVKEMKSHSAKFMGATKSMADYYNGYSLIIFVFLVMSVFVLWILSNHISTSQRLVKQILYAVGIAYLFLGVIEFFNFFPFVAIISILIGLFSVLATLRLNNQ